MPVMMSGEIELPPYPTEIWSPLGLIPVIATQLEQAVGEWDSGLREIRRDPRAQPVVGWQAIGHEMSHMILDDSGVSEVLSKKQEEAVCRAFGSFIASWILSGGPFPFTRGDNE